MQPIQTAMKPKQIRKIIQIDEELCDGCGLCVPDCAEGSLQIIDGKAKLVADNLCDGLGACLGSCPTGALKIIEREADEFDEEAVEAFLAEKGRAEELKPAPGSMQPRPAPLQAPKPAGCPSAQLRTFAPSTPCSEANRPTRMASDTAGAGSPSLLSHWPVQIRLIPPHAPFLKDADVLVAADCSAVSAPCFQERYVDGKVVMMGCPKFDDAESYIQKFADILTTSGIKSLTLLIMEVPCCSAMNAIIKRAVERAGVSVPVEQITLSLKGEELERISW